MKKIIMVAVFLLVAVSVSAQMDVIDRVLSGDECAELGGEIINTLSQEDCGDGEYLGEVDGMRCPCICCKEKDAAVDTGVSEDAEK